MDAELFVHSEIERDVQTLDKIVATVGIARKVGLPHPSDEMEDATFARINRSDAEKEEIAPRYKGVGRCIGRLMLIHGERGVGERIATELS